MRRRNKDIPEPLWVSSLNDVQIVEKFKLLVDRPSFTYETIGRYIVDMRKRLLPILIDGLAAKEQPK